MMKIKSPELFYWFRRAFGFFLLFAINSYSAQVSLVGDVVIVDNTEHPDVHIATGTYIHGFGNTEKDKGNKDVIREAVAKKKDSVAKPSVSKKRHAEPVYAHHYAPVHNKEILSSASPTKIALTTNNDHHKKQLILVHTSHPTISYRLTVYETFDKIEAIKLEYSDRHFRIRPPPPLNTI